MPKKNHTIKISLLILTGMLAPSTAQGVPESQWQGTTSTELDVAANWSTNPNLPGPGTNAVFAQGTTVLTYGGIFMPLMNVYEFSFPPPASFNPYIFDFYGSTFILGSDTQSQGGVYLTGGEVPQFNINAPATLQFLGALTTACSGTGATYNANGGVLTFGTLGNTGPAPDTCTASNATITATGGGEVNFYSETTAGSSAITIGTGSPSPSKASLLFDDSANAGTATIAIVDGPTNFYTNSSASGSTINMSGGPLNFGRLGNTGPAPDTSTAATATITATGGSEVNFYSATTAGAAIININNLSTINFGGLGNTGPAADISTAATATITATGGCQVNFYSSTTADAATINLNASLITFSDSAQGGTCALTLNNDSELAINVPSPVLTLGSLAGLDTGSSVSMNGNSLTVGSLNGNQSFLGNITSTSGTPTLTKNGTGTWTLSGTNSYSGGTVVEAGTLVATTIAAIPGGTSGINVSSGATMDFEIGASATYTGYITGAGDVIFNPGANNTFVLNGLVSSPAPYTGQTTVSNGTLEFENTNGVNISMPISLATANSSVYFDQQLGSNMVSGQITGAGSVTINRNGEAGTVVFNNTSSLNPNNYTGVTTIQSGTLELLNSTLTNSSILLNNNVLDFETTGSIIYGNNGNIISGSGSVVINATPGNTGTVIYESGNTYTGLTTISGGTLELNNVNLPDSNILDNGLLDFELTSGSETYSKNITGSGGVQINTTSPNAGTIVFNGVNTYTGGTTIAGGSLVATTIAAIPGGTSGINVSSGATMDFKIGTNGTYTGYITGAGGVTLNAPSRTLVLDGLVNSPAPYTGQTTVTSGTLEFDNIHGVDLSTPISLATVNSSVDFNQPSGSNMVSGAITGAGNVVINGAGGSGTVVFNNTVSYSGTTDINAGTLDFDITGNSTLTSSVFGAGNLIKDGANTLILDQPNYLGTTTVNDGTLQFNALPLTSAITLASVGTVDFEQTSGTGTYSGSITGTGQLDINQQGGTGTVVLTNTNSVISGTATVFGGELEFDNSANYSFPGSLVNNGTAIDIEQAASTTGTFGSNGSIIAGSGNFAINTLPGNTGTVVFEGAVNYTGTTNINAGTLDFDLTGLHTTLPSSVYGAGNLIKDGATPLLLFQPNYTGTTTINDGTLQFNAIPLTSEIILTSSSGPATVDFEQPSSTTGTYSNPITGTGDVVVNSGLSDTGTLALTNPGNNYTGGTTVYNGTLLVTPASLPGNLVNDATVDFEQTSGTGTYNGQITGPGQLDINKLGGTGTVVLTNATSVIPGTAEVFGGVLEFDNSANYSFPGNLISNGATTTIDIEQAVSTTGTFGSNSSTISGSGNFAINTVLGNAGTVVFEGAVSYTGTTNINAGALDFDVTGNTTLPGSVFGAGNLIKDGANTLILDQPNYLGTTTINDGILQLNAIPSSSAIILTNSSGTATVDFEIGASGTYTGYITGAGDVIVNAGTGTFVLDGLVSSPAPYTGQTTVTSGTLEFDNINGVDISMPISLPNANSSVDFNQPSGSNVVSGAITGVGSVEINGDGGSGTVVFNNTSSLNPSNYTGSTTITAGTLELNNTTLTNSSIINQGVLDFETTGSIIYGNNGNIISGAGSVVINATAGNNGTVIYDSINTYTGQTTISGGTLVLNNVTLPNSSIVDNGLLDFELTSGSETYSQVIIGSGGVQINTTPGNVGSIVFTGANTYTGVTTVAGGTLVATTTAAIPGAPSGIDVFSMATMDFEIGASGTYTGYITGAGDVIVNAGTGTFVLDGLVSTPAPYTGQTTVTSGNLEFDNINGVDISMPISLPNANSSVDFNQPSGSNLVSGAITGAGSVVINGVGGSGTVVFNNTSSVNPNSYTGPTTITAGTLKLKNSTLTNSSILNEGVLDFETTGSIIYGNNGNIISGAGSVVINATAGNNGKVIYDSTNIYTGQTTISGGTLVLNNVTLPNSSIVDNGLLDFELTSGSYTYSKVITGSGGVKINTTRGNVGTIVFTGANKYTGVTTIAGGTLELDNCLLSGNIVDNALLDLELSSGKETYKGVISGSGAVSINTLAGNTGRVIFTGNNTYTGLTTIKAGALELDNFTLPGNIANSGLLDFERKSGAETYKGIISGKGAVNINATAGNTGTVIFNGPNTYTGLTTIYAGTLQLNNVTLRGNIKNNGLLDFEKTGGAPLVYNGVISGKGSVSINTIAGNKGTVIFNGKNTYAGLTTIGGGTLQLNNVLLPGNIVDQGTLDLEIASGSETYAGVISGKGGVVINSNSHSAGKVIFSGANSYQGGTTVANGTLQGNSRSLPGNFNIKAPGTLNFNQNSSANFNGIFSGAGTIQKNGKGRLDFTANSPNFSGVMDVLAGNLALNSTLGGSGVVYKGATLSGNGSLLGNLLLESGATISPGNNKKSGHFNVFGNYTQMSKATYQLIVDKASIIEVGGKATLDKGSILAIYYQSGQLPVGQRPAVILKANKGLAGTFTTVTSNNPLITTAIEYTAKEVILNAVNAISVLPAAVTPNQQYVIDQLESITNPTPQETELLLTLLNLPTDEAEKALNQMTGQQYTTTLLTAELASRQFIRRLYDPVRNIIFTPQCCCSPCLCGEEFNLDGWTEISGSQSFFKGDSNASGIKTGGYEICGGTHLTIDHLLTLGVAASYEENHIHYNVGGSGKNNTAFGALYGVFRPAGFYVLSDVAYGYTCDTMHRTIDVGDLSFRPQSKPTVHQGNVYAEIGKDFGMSYIVVQPFVGVELGHYRFARITEKGGSFLDLEIAKKSLSTVDGRLGVHVTRLKCDYGLDFSIDVAWNYRFTPLDNKIKVNFEEFGSRFPIEGFKLYRNSVEAAVTVQKQINNNWRIYVEGGAEAWLDVVSYSVIGGIQASW